MGSERFVIEARAVPPFMKNGFILGCNQTRRAAYIDPGDEVSQLLEWVDKEGLELESILLTHAHMDHISGVSQVKKKWDVPIYLHPDDAFLYERAQEQAQAFGLECPPAPPYERELADGQSVQVGDLRLEVHHTPGHSPGGVCLVVDDHVFCGDAVFAGSIGRTDLPGGSYETLIASIRNRILPLGDSKILHPGHGPDTSVGRERRTNPFLN